MEDNTLAQSNLIATAEETQTLEDYLAEMLRLRSEIDAEQEEIERLKANNRELKAETRAMLATLKATVLNMMKAVSALLPEPARLLVGGTADHLDWR